MRLSALNLTNKRPDSALDFMILVARNPVPLLHGTYRLAQFPAEYCAKWVISRRWKGNVTVMRKSAAVTTKSL